MSSNVLVLGAGGREHALVWKLSQSSHIGHIYCAPGNGGIEAMDNVTCVPIGSSKKDFPALVEFAQKHNVKLLVPGPEQPLVDGVADVFAAVGIPSFGPSAKAARMEGSKAFAKDFMHRHNIPTAEYHNFTDYATACKYVESCKTRVVIKASGIAAGKGVLIPTNKQEALDALKEVMVDRQFGSAGDEVVVEEYLEGDELSILCLSDGYSYVYLPPAQDHKRAGNGDTGLNTGGMGAYAPAPLGTPQLLKQIEKTVLEPSISGMRKDGYPMLGCLFVGLMITPTGEPKVLEYNVRFGDPETQTVLPLLKSDLYDLMVAAVEHRLDSVEFSLRNGESSATVVMAASGYPVKYHKGDELTIKSPLPNDTFIFHAGTKLEKGKLFTDGGRVIAATAVSNTLEDAVARAYVGVDYVSFKGKYNRDDIAHRAFDKSGKKSTLTYEAAGVSVDAGNALVDEIKPIVKSTSRPGADSDLGGFGGLFDLKAAGYHDIDNTLLVGATDGVGTKLRIAQVLGLNDTVGIDLVAMNVNDLIVQGAEPLFFLDYFATGHLDVPTAKVFVSGVAEGCRQAGCALVGGETSEMPGMYAPGHYDTNGTAVGAVLRDQMLPRVTEMEPGDVLLGLASDGIHSNGFSLVRKILETSGHSYSEKASWNNKSTIGREVLKPTRIYVKQLLPTIRSGLILGLAHITGGGLVENVPRALPKNLSAKIDMSTWKVPSIFTWFGEAGHVPVPDMLKTFNLGVGMVVIVKPENASKVSSALTKAGERVYTIGKLIKRENNMAGCIVDNAELMYKKD